MYIYDLGWDGEWNGYPFQYSSLENPMYRGALGATVHGVAESDMIEQLTHTHTHNLIYCQMF